MEAKKFGESIEDEYFIRSNGDEIAWNTEAIYASPSEKPLIAITPLGDAFFWRQQIFIYNAHQATPLRYWQQPLSRLGLTILDAKISHDDRNFTLDSFVLLWTVMNNDTNLISRTIRAHHSIRKTLSGTT